MANNPKKDAALDKELAEIIRKAQEQPGIGDLEALMKPSEELESLSREQRDVAGARSVYSATGTGYLT